MMRHFLWILLLLIIAAPMVHASQGSLKLLAVQQRGQDLTGSIADLHLEIKSGSGRIFVDTFPLTKLDTQVSTRFAKEIACDYLDNNCKSYDFFYTIRSDSPILAGPSAGAAISALTISLLGDIKIAKDVTITGTINSGGIIGPVGGLKEKIEAASQNGIKKVLIPYGERYVIKEQPTINLSEITSEHENMTAKELLDNRLDLVVFGEDLGIEVVEVSDIDDVIFEFTGQRRDLGDGNLEIDESYKKTMEKLANELCYRSDDLRKQIDDKEILDEDYIKIFENAKNMSIKGKEIMKDGKPYSSASYCFGSNVKFGHVVLYLNNETDSELRNRIDSIQEEIENYEIPEYHTITDLQAYMVVEERMANAAEFLEKAEKKIDENRSDDALGDIAYSIERKFSGYAWSMFINGEGKEFSLSQDDMKESCQKKLAEAEERYQYVILFLPTYLTNIREEIDEAYSEFNNQNYASCLFKASRSKANIDVILSVFGVEKNDLDDLIDRKIQTVEKMIYRQGTKGIFPIVGYSYYEYAKDLKESDQYLSLLYCEYALEMSNLDIYFPEKREIIFTDQDKNEIGIFLLGLGAGLLVGIIIMLKARSIPSASTKKSKKKQLKKR